jgi:hypothetical protein
MQRKTSTTLYCFSPPVMLATFTIEIAFAFYILWRYKMTTITRLVVVMLASLAAFQGAEYAVCGGIGAGASIWSRLGYCAISLLPALGLHLILTIANQKRKYLLAAAYASSAAFVLYYGFATAAIDGHTCYANYAVFNISEASGIPYILYYYGWMALGVGLAWHYSLKLKKQRAALRALALGYLAFILPTSTINMIDPSTIAGVPSIMCGFAILFAFVLTTRVAPLTADRKDGVSLQPRSKRA